MRFMQKNSINLFIEKSYFLIIFNQKIHFGFSWPLNMLSSVKL